jgi:hypothetical protein
VAKETGDLDKAIGDFSASLDKLGGRFDWLYRETYQAAPIGEPTEGSAGDRNIAKNTRGSRWALQIAVFVISIAVLIGISAGAVIFYREQIIVKIDGITVRATAVYREKFTPKVDEIIDWINTRNQSDPTNLDSKRKKSPKKEFDADEILRSIREK